MPPLIREKILPPIDPYEFERNIPKGQLVGEMFRKTDKNLGLLSEPELMDNYFGENPKTNLFTLQEVSQSANLYMDRLENYFTVKTTPLSSSVILVDNKYKNSIVEENLISNQLCDTNKSNLSDVIIKVGSSTFHIVNVYLNGSFNKLQKDQFLKEVARIINHNNYKNLSLVGDFNLLLSKLDILHLRDPARYENNAKVLKSFMANQKLLDSFREITRDQFFTNGAATNYSRINFNLMCKAVFCKLFRVSAIWDGISTHTSIHYDYVDTELHGDWLFNGQLDGRHNEIIAYTSKNYNVRYNKGNAMIQFGIDSLKLVDNDDGKLLDENLEPEEFEDVEQQVLKLKENGEGDLYEIYKLIKQIVPDGFEQIVPKKKDINWTVSEVQVLEMLSYIFDDDIFSISKILLSKSFGQIKKKYSDLGFKTDFSPLNEVEKKFVKENRELSPYQLAIKLKRFILLIFDELNSLKTDSKETGKLTDLKKFKLNDKKNNNNKVQKKAIVRMTEEQTRFLSSQFRQGMNQNDVVKIFNEKFPDTGKNAKQIKQHFNKYSSGIVAMKRAKRKVEEKNVGTSVQASKKVKLSEGIVEEAIANKKGVKFSSEEDEKIRKFVKDHGPNWSEWKSDYIIGRTMKQCQQRFTKHLVVNSEGKADLKKDEIIDLNAKGKGISEISTIVCESKSLVSYILGKHKKKD